MATRGSGAKAPSRPAQSAHCIGPATRAPAPSRPPARRRRTSCTPRSARRGAVVDARRVAGGHRAVGARDGPKRREALERGVGPRLLVAAGMGAITARPGYGDGDDLLLKNALGLGPRRALLAAERIGVLVGA